MQNMNKHAPRKMDPFCSHDSAGSLPPFCVCVYVCVFRCPDLAHTALSRPPGEEALSEAGSTGGAADRGRGTARPEDQQSQEEAPVQGRSAGRPASGRT